MATLYAKAAGGNWSSANSWSNVSSAGSDNSGPPTSTTDVILDSGSGNTTIDANITVKTVDCTGYTGTLTHTSGVNNSPINLNIAGNLFKFVAGMTYTTESGDRARINFQSTSGTCLIACGGKSLPRIFV